MIRSHANEPGSFPVCFLTRTFWNGQGEKSPQIQALRKAPVKLRCLGVVAAFLLGGCGNAYEHLSVNEWQEVGLSQPPMSELKGKFTVATIRVGEGGTVTPGDLVKASILVTTVPVSSTAAQHHEPQVVWLWVGQEPGLDFEWQQIGSFGSEGSARVRRTMIGRKLGEEFTMYLDQGAEDSPDEIPIRGFIDPVESRNRRSVVVDGQWVRSIKLPSLKFRDNSGVSSAMVKILNICSAKLFRRTATLRQWGAVIGLGDEGEFSRKGMLGWSMIDAQCPAPDGQVRFQAGPFYHRGESGNLGWDWEGSYIRLRPPKKFPEEWEPE